MVEGVTEYAIFMLDRDGVVVTWNQGAVRTKGYLAEEVIGRHFSIFYPPEDAAAGKPKRELEQALAEGFFEEEGLRLDKAGTPFWASVTITPLFEVSGSLAGFVKVSRDITVQKRNQDAIRASELQARVTLEAQLRQAQKMEAFGQLAGGVAHDFNNLLTVITGYGEILLDLVPADDERHDMLEEVNKAARAAAQLTRHLLAFSRQQILEPKIVDLNDIVQGVERMLGRLIGEDVELSMTLRRGIRRVKVDPGQIEQVIVNLAVNARDAMPQGGQLTLETREIELGPSYTSTHSPDAVPGLFVMLAIADTGIGMTPEVRARIFEPFFTTKEVGRGSGLGLAVVHGIVKQSGGNIDVYSEQGAGTTFKVYLPAVRDPAAEDTLRSSEPPPRGAETILLVEDADDVRDLAVAALRTYGYTVLAAPRGADALRAMYTSARTVDLLITDVVMPEMSGRMLAETLVASYPDLKVLFISGYTDDAIVRHGVLQADVAFLQKPFTPRSLARKVREVLDT